MFYDTERTIRKNLKYEKTKAYGIVSDLENKGLVLQEMIEAVKILLNGENNEFQIDILKRAKAILETRKEITDETEDSGSNPGANNISIDCPVLHYQRKLQYV